MSKNGHNSLLWIAIFVFWGRKIQIMTKKILFFQNTTHNGGSIKNPMNPKRKTKLYAAKKFFFSISCIYRKISSIKAEGLFFTHLLYHRFSSDRTGDGSVIHNSNPSKYSSWFAL